MKMRKLALFGGAAVIVAGGVIYSLGIYPPAASRYGRGAIGQREVYRAEQPADASVTPGAAPVATKATAEALKIPQLQNGMYVGVTSGAIYQAMNGQLVALTAAQAAGINKNEVRYFKNGDLVYLQGNAMPLAVVNAGFNQLLAGQMVNFRGITAQVAANGIVSAVQNSMANQMRNGIVNNAAQQ